MKLTGQPGFLDRDDFKRKTIHIYPTTQCNMNCIHCYSDSEYKPHEKGIDPEYFYPFLKYAYKNGFNTVSISGGEPFLYSGLDSLIYASKEIGFEVHITTNGTLLNQKKVKRLIPLIDYIEVSLDGMLDLHNEIHNDPNAFSELLKGVDILKNYAQNFGFVHTLTSKSWDSLLWLAEFVFENQGSKLRIHPLEMAGRAISPESDLLELDQLTLHKVYYIHNYLQNKYKGRIELDLDVRHKSYIEQHPESIYVYPDVKNYSVLPLSDIFSDIVVDENGDILPVGYGFSTQFIISNLYFFKSSFDIFHEYMKENGRALKNYFMQSYWDMINDKEKEYINPTEALTKHSWNVKVFEFA